MRREPSEGTTTLRVNDGPKGDLAGLLPTLRALKDVDPTASVILDVQGNIPWGEVIQVYDNCRLAKFRAINFAATPTELQ